ncbi:solute carrier family 26 member 6-like isoform X2 [Sitodiplosis mosellana]|nr:solute carrier family 26 member 6-like isoform X2 [Sitodiplosis mosellana]XP_055316398.1 solute carrier family 26 member 6-like isoform X2 [Sitodiplosis mosellana]XP_055316399.1 solute carrier family 26 member 6-like isoform X2 [Sitodiplosis mosellana]XP_055316400.1 solute carrier family 26 member 6-like isoform X2 [Sitodiplosis mosellana]
MTIQTSVRLNTDATAVWKVERPFYEQQQFNNELNYCKPEDDRKTSCSQWIYNIKPTNIFLSIFPIFTWLSQYNIKNDLVGDVVSGCTVAIMHIPQGMGYAMLANIPPIAGIYTAFFPVLVYFIFGTSKHNSMGTFAVISIMVGKSVLKYAQDSVTFHPAENNSISHADEIWTMEQPIYTPMQVVTSLCLIVGCIQLVMYVLRLGIMSSLLSETLVSGFTTGAAIHVFTSQVKDLLGIKLSPVVGNFKIILNYLEIFSSLSAINWTAVVISVVTITLLYLNNELLKPKLNKICLLPVPIELIAVVAGTLVSRYLDLSMNYNIKTIGHIPTGFPAFDLPDLELSKQLFMDGFIISMVSYTVSVSMALIFAQKLNYEIDFNQELLAMGASNVCGSFFSCLPLSASLSRSAIQQSTGGRTQIASIVSCALLTFVLLWVGPFFELLPRCVLASIIVVALKGMLLQVKQFVQFWKMSHLDAVVWLVTFLTVVIFSIDIGLLVGIVLSLACIFIRGLKPYTCLLGHIPKTDLYLDIKRYKAAEEMNGIKIFHYCGSLNFASRASFKSELCSLIRLDLASEMRNHSTSTQQRYESIDLKCLIIDFSALSYIDPSSVSSLKLLIDDFNKLSIKVFISGASCPAYDMMKRCGLNEKPDSSFNFFPTIHDAVHQAMDNLAPISVITE